MSSQSDAGAKPRRVPLGALKPLLPYALVYRSRIAAASTATTPIMARK